MNSTIEHNQAPVLSVSTAGIPTAGISTAGISTAGQSLRVLSPSGFTQQTNMAFKSYQSTLVLSRSPLANSSLITPTLVKDDASPTAEERGHGLRLLLQWAVAQIAPAPVVHPLGTHRPFDDPTWRDPLWWRYNLLRHRYLEPLHPDDFVEGGRYTETLMALLGIPTADAFFDERNRAVRQVAQRLRQQFIDEQANEVLQRLALSEAVRPLQSQPQRLKLLGIAAVFDQVFPRALLLKMAEDESIARAGAAVDALVARRYLLMGDDEANLWLSPVLRAYLYARQPAEALHRRHRAAAAHGDRRAAPLSAAYHWRRAGQSARSTRILFEAAEELIHELQISELIEALSQFDARSLATERWVEVQILLADLYHRVGQQAEALNACRQALKAAAGASVQARIYRRMGKLYEKYNQLHAANYYQKAAELFTRTDAELPVMLKDSGWLHIWRKEWDEAEAKLTDALDCVDASESTLRADIFDALASLHRDRKHFDYAIHYARQALSLREEAGNQPRIAASFNNLGLLYSAMSNYPNAIAAFDEAIDLYKRLGNPELHAAALLNVGMAYHLQQNVKAAVRFYEMSLDASTQIRFHLGEIRACYNLAEVLSEQEQFHIAQGYWQQGWTLSRDAGFDDEMRDLEALAQRFPSLKAADKNTSAPTLEVQTAIAATGEDHRAALDLAAQHGRLTAGLLVEQLHISKATATRRLAALVEQGRLAKRGKGRGTHYVLVETASQPHVTLNGEPRLSDAARHLARRFGASEIRVSDASHGGYLCVTAHFARPPDVRDFLRLEDELSALLHVHVNLKLAP